MNRTFGKLPAAPAAFTCLALATALPAGADWLAYRHDLARSGLTREALPKTLHLKWSYRLRHKPRPAWPEPGRELNRLAFDYAPALVVSQGLVLFGSSADHKLYALDAATGAERWSFFTGGPVRFAPAVQDGRVFFGSDDGFVRCLELESGALVWSFFAGPRRELLFGNQQLMGRWPIRSGVGVSAGTVYFAAGMWPSEGVYLYALRARDGAVLWRRHETARHYQRQPHPGSYAFIGVAPQGYLLADATRLFFPTGRNVPAAFRRKDGRFLYYHGAPETWGNRWGGAWNMLVRNRLIGWRNHVVPDMDSMVGEARPDPRDGFVVFDTATGNRVFELAGKLCAVADGRAFYATGAGKIGAYDLDSWFGGKGWHALWESPCERTYCLIKAGDTLAAGQAGKASLYSAKTGKKRAELPVTGEVRSLAAAAGRLFASTTAGFIYAYGSGNAGNPLQRRPGKDIPLARRLAAEPTARERIATLLAESGIRSGFCLVLNRADAPFLYQLAGASDLTIFTPLAAADEVERLRRTLDAVDMYGPRVVVQAGNLATLHYPAYFANLIVLDAPAGFQPPWPALRVYRLLRPCGGVLYIRAGRRNSPEQRTRLRRWLEHGGVPASEISTTANALMVRRGKLPKSDDWSHEYGNAARSGSSADERVKLPLRLLWFGKPGPATIISRHWQGPAPLCVNGRMFVTGQRRVTALDAYNGRILWQREFSRAGRWSIPGKGSNVAATADSFFLATGRRCLRLDAATGKLLHTYPIPAVPDLPAALRKSLDTWCFLAVDGTQVFGSMGPSESAGRCLYALNQASGALEWSYLAPGPVANNAVSVTRDSVFLIERIGNADVERARRRGIIVRAGKRLVALDRRSGAVRWTTSEKIGRRTTLWFSDGILVALGGGGFSGYNAASGKLLYSRSASFRRSPVITKGVLYIQPFAYDLFTGKLKYRPDPLSDARAPWNFVRSYGCGSMAGGPGLLAFRSGTLGFYGLDGDTGVHNFPAIRAGCCINAVPADGLLLVSPGDAGCSCSYSYQTTLALAPDPARDSWGIFFDRLPNDTVRHAALNFGAPGDRRARNGALWLATPRPNTRTHRRDIAIPFRFECFPGFGPYYRPPNPEGKSRRLPLAWVYSSGLRGVRHVELDLDILDRGFTCRYAGAAPNIDGKLQESIWDGYKAYPAQSAGASIMLRYDRKALYLGCRRPLAGGEPKPTVRTGDGPVWKDGAFEILVSNLPARGIPHGTTCLHFAVSPGGVRYDAEWSFVSAYGYLDIPELSVRIDGDPADWAGGGLRVASLPGPGGRLRAKANLDPCFRIAWSPKGLLVLARITDNVLWESPHPSRLYQGDSIELFMTPHIGGSEAFQVIIAPPDGKRYKRPRYRFYDRRHATRKKHLHLEVAGVRTPHGYVLETLLPWDNLGIRPARGAEFGLQIFVNDSDRGPIRGPQALWHPAGSPANNALAYQGFRLAAKAAPPLVFKRAASPDRHGLYPVRQPAPFPTAVPPLGGRKEDPAYNGRWQSAVSLTRHAVQAEIAIPWQTIARAGLDPKKVMVAVHLRGPLAAAPRMGRGFERLLLIPKSRNLPRYFDLSLHFADPDNTEPGHRVFALKIQGRTVLSHFDIAAAAEFPHGPVIRRFRHIPASEALFLDFIPQTPGRTPDRVPILNGIEFHEVKR